ncbi:hypothetical protein VTJ49DRAFT_7639 [Mycothermus thermophilus]|uniref:Cytochrome P450 n=1 Tax=Humicola insolens TaxID=85995 RepID=A0ABR3VGF7_HUMIN
MGFVVEYGNYTLPVAISILVYLLVLRTEPITRNGSRLRKPPDTLPLLGNGIKFLQSRWKLLAWFDDCQRRFGYETVSLSVPTLPPGVLIQSPENLDYVFKNEGVLFGKGDFVKGRSWDLFGNGIINADGDLWKRQRKAGLAFLNTANLRVLTEVALPQYLAETLDDVRSRAAQGPVLVDLQHVFLDITTKLMGRMAYNMEMRADDEFTRCFDHASGVTASRFQNPLWRVTELFTGQSFRHSLGVVKDFGQRIVAGAVQDRERKATKAEEGSSSDTKLERISGSLIQSLLDALGGDEATVADAALTYLSAGRDTTAQALTWTFYLLAQHPEAVAEIRREVDCIRSEQEEQEQGSVAPSPSLLTTLTPSNLPYTTALFHESMRLYPPIPIEIRQCLSPTQLPDGRFLRPHEESHILRLFRFVALIVIRS